MSNETPYGVALELLRLIAFAESKNINIASVGGNADAPNREWILKTYAQCFSVIERPGTVGDYLNWKIAK